MTRPAACGGMARNFQFGQMRFAPTNAPLHTAEYMLANSDSTPAVFASALTMGAVELFFAPTEADFIWSAEMFSARAGKASRKEVVKPRQCSRLEGRPSRQFCQATGSQNATHASKCSRRPLRFSKNFQNQCFHQVCGKVCQGCARKCRVFHRLNLYIFSAL